ncbi:hypothetical protein MKX03_030954, partial [Papaver bracteatum]
MENSFHTNLCASIFHLRYLISSNKIKLKLPNPNPVIPLLFSIHSPPHLPIYHLHANNIAYGEKKKMDLKFNPLTFQSPQKLPTFGFPNVANALVLEVCDETDIAELNLKVGGFEMKLRRNIGATKSQPLVSTLTPPPVPSEPMVDSAPAPAPSVTSTPSKETTTPFKNVSFGKSSKLTALEASGANGYVLVSSPMCSCSRLHHSELVCRESM